MPTPKLNRLAQMFMQRIQDPILIDIANVILPGSVIRSVVEIEEYLDRAGMALFNASWKAAQPQNEAPGTVSHKNRFLNMFPELFKFKQVTLEYTSDNHSILDLSNPTNQCFDIYDILDSIKAGGGGLIEVWQQSKLADALAESDPFCSPPRVTASFPGMILQQPKVYFFPNNLAATTYTFTLNYIQNLKNPTNGEILRSGGAYDIAYSEQHLEDVAELAAKIFNKDDFQEDAGA